MGRKKKKSNQALLFVAIGGEQKKKEGRRNPSRRGNIDFPRGVGGKTTLKEDGLKQGREQSSAHASTKKEEKDGISVMGATQSKPRWGGSQSKPNSWGINYMWENQRTQCSRKKETRGFVKNGTWGKQMQEGG